MTIAAAETPSDALGSIAALRPDAIVIDSNLPDGIEAVGRFFCAAPDVPVIALGVAENEDAVLPWAEAGIAGYVPRSASI
jgi:two-component system nitrate/nitrite response regulator NarL